MAGPSEALSAALAQLAWLVATVSGLHVLWKELAPLLVLLRRQLEASAAWPGLPTGPLGWRLRRRAASLALAAVGASVAWPLLLRLTGSALQEPFR